MATWYLTTLQIKYCLEVTYCYIDPEMFGGGDHIFHGEINSGLKLSEMMYSVSNNANFLKVVFIREKIDISKMNSIVFIYFI